MLPTKSVKDIFLSKDIHSFMIEEGYVENNNCHYSTYANLDSNKILFHKNIGTWDGSSLVIDVTKSQIAVSVEYTCGGGSSLHVENYKQGDVGSFCEAYDSMINTIKLCYTDDE